MTFHGGFQNSHPTRNSVASHSRPRWSRKAYAMMFGLCAVALLNTNLMMSSGHRALAGGAGGIRKLCSTIFDYPDWRSYWEDLFPDVKIYDGIGDQRAQLPTDANNIGYFVTLMSCPGDDYKAKVENQYDPGHALYDAAALLKYSITRNTYPAGSKYNATMYAIVHPSAVVCKTPNGDPYDRVQVLQDLGYIVTILGQPFSTKAITDGYVRDNIDQDTGDRDFMRLFAVTFDNHPAIVMVDFTTLMMQPIDVVYDSFIGDPNLKYAYSMDYPDHLPEGSNAGPNMHWLIMKPDPALFQSIIDSYTSTMYSRDWGWNNQGVKQFDGVFGVKGYLMHHMSRADGGHAYLLSRCIYGNDGSDPYTSDGSSAVCRDNGDCSDCRTTPFSDIKIIKMIHTCGEPWKCGWDDSLDAATQAKCEGFHREWFSARIDFEESCWHNGPPSFRNGQFHPDVFMGFCTGPGIVGYDRMIDDKSSASTCDSHWQDSTDAQTLDFGNGRGQDQRLTLTTGKVTGNTVACVKGSITKKDFEIPYNIGIVIDLSGSTRGPFGGNPTGDVNGDGDVDNILDAEIASIVALMEHIASDSALSNDNVNIGLVSFSTQAIYHGQFSPLDPNDSSKINPDLNNILMAMRSGGFTHFDDALDKVALFFQEAPTDRSNLLFFLSDGIPNVPGDGDNEEPLSKYTNNDPQTLKYDSEIAILDGLNVQRLAIGVGAGSDIREGFGLDKIDNTPDAITGVRAEQVTTTGALTDVLLRNPVEGTIIDFDIKVNGVSQGNIDASKLKSGPTGFTFGRFVVNGMKPSFGEMNQITATATIDFDGSTDTTNDQITLTTSNELPGMLH